ncbi:acyl carrier protein [Thermobifida halotolerans]|uniref:Acyl carrier protein n=1 Tax=Thermobifida halotolerans TaxID=483545 RepID=A0A399FWL7_9ACTN|nr:phosphopantetheine-binding protein [Thermobifida halotolerans]UOE21255.1 acyl carrier protein [Thermobifida halotolerans]
MSATPNTVPAEEIQRLTLRWAAELLEEPEVLPEDNFLELGGHSMLALQMAERAKKRFGAEYDLMILFEKDFAAAAAELAHRITGD